VTRLGGTANGFAVRFPAQPEREYRVSYDDQRLTATAWSNATPQPITVSAPQVYEWLDDGAATEPDPAAATSRFYRVDAVLPP